MFHVKKNASQTIVFNKSIKVTWQYPPVFDPDGAFDFTNHRFRPLLAGKYLIHARVEIKRGEDNLFDFNLAIRRNLYPYAGEFGLLEQITNNESDSITSLIDLNGIDDYVELWVYTDSTGTVRPTVEANSWFTGYRVGS